MPLDCKKTQAKGFLLAGMLKDEAVGSFLKWDHTDNAFSTRGLGLVMVGVLEVNKEGVDSGVKKRFPWGIWKNLSFAPR